MIYKRSSRIVLKKANRLSTALKALRTQHLKKAGPQKRGKSTLLRTGPFSGYTVENCG
jgi:hypothetical protein